MNAPQAHQDGQQAASPTVDAAAVLRDHWTMDAYCYTCEFPWRGDAETGGCDAVLLAREVTALEGRLTAVLAVVEAEEASRNTAVEGADAEAARQRLVHQVATLRASHPGSASLWGIVSVADLELVLAARPAAPREPLGLGEAQCAPRTPPQGEGGGELALLRRLRDALEAWYGPDVPHGVKCAGDFFPVLDALEALRAAAREAARGEGRG